jgi:hypothetical protein
VAQAGFWVDWCWSTALAGLRRFGGDFDSVTVVAGFFEFFTGDDVPGAVVVADTDYRAGLAVVVEDDSAVVAGVALGRVNRRVVAPPETFVISESAFVVAEGAGCDLLADIAIPFVPFLAFCAPFDLKVVCGGACAAWAAAARVFGAEAFGALQRDLELGDPFRPGFWMKGVVVVVGLGKWRADPVGFSAVVFSAFACLFVLLCGFPRLVLASGVAALSTWLVYAPWVPEAVAAGWLVFFF